MHTANYAQLQRKKMKWLELRTFSFNFQMYDYKKKYRAACYTITLGSLKIFIITWNAFCRCLLVATSFKLRSVHELSLKYNARKSKRLFIFQNEIWPSFPPFFFSFTYAISFTSLVLQISRKKLQGIKMNNHCNQHQFGIIPPKWLTWEYQVINPNHLQGLSRKINDS